MNMQDINNTSVVWFEFIKNRWFWFFNISELENHQFQFFEKNSELTKTLVWVCFKNFKELTIFMKELVSNTQL